MGVENSQSSVLYKQWNFGRKPWKTEQEKKTANIAKFQYNAGRTSGL
jgi:hypothetical protein